MDEDPILRLKCHLYIFLSGLLEKGIYRPNDICVALFLLASELDLEFEASFLNKRKPEKHLRAKVNTILDKLSISEDEFKESIQNLKSKEVIENINYEFYNQ